MNTAFISCALSQTYYISRFLCIFMHFLCIFMLEDLLFLKCKCVVALSRKKILWFYATHATSKICKKKLLQCNHAVCHITIQHMMFMLNNFWKSFLKKISCKYVSYMYYEYVLSYVLSYHHMYCQYNVMNENICTNSNILDIHIHRIIPKKKIIFFSDEKICVNRIWK